MIWSVFEEPRTPGETLEFSPKPGEQNLSGETTALADRGSHEVGEV